MIEAGLEPRHFSTPSRDARTDALHGALPTGSMRTQRGPRTHPGRELIPDDSRELGPSGSAQAPKWFKDQQNGTHVIKSIREILPFILQPRQEERHRFASSWHTATATLPGVMRRAPGGGGEASVAPHGAGAAYPGPRCSLCETNAHCRLCWGLPRLDGQAKRNRSRRVSLQRPPSCQEASPTVDPATPAPTHPLTSSRNLPKLSLPPRHQTTSAETHESQLQGDKEHDAACNFVTVDAPH